MSDEERAAEMERIRIRRRAISDMRGSMDKIADGATRSIGLLPDTSGDAIAVARERIALAKRLERQLALESEALVDVHNALVMEGRP